MILKRHSAAGMKVVVLVLLWAQNTAHSMTVNHVRKVRGERFITSSAVMLSEVLKMAFSLRMLAAEAGQEASGAPGVMELVSDYRLAVPAGLYFGQNVMTFVALQHIDSSVFNVVAQSKLLTTAVFSVVLLGRRLSWRRWRALILLTLGVMLVLTPPPSCVIAEAAPGDAVAAAAASSSRLFGIVATLGIAASSGFAGVYFERVLKGSRVSLYARQVQLGFWSMVCCLLSMVLFDARDIGERGLFVDYSPWTLLSVVLSACGGVLVALVVKYGDSIIKGYATSSAILSSAVLGHLFYGNELSPLFLLGAGVVIISLFNYSEAEADGGGAAATAAATARPAPVALVPVTKAAPVS